jgi:hypothetical protein
VDLALIFKKKMTQGVLANQHHQLFQETSTSDPPCFPNNPSLNRRQEAAAC